MSFSKKLKSETFVIKPLSKLFFFRTFPQNKLKLLLFARNWNFWLAEQTKCTVCRRIKILHFDFIQYITNKRVLWCCWLWHQSDKYEILRVKKQNSGLGRSTKHEICLFCAPPFPRPTVFCYKMLSRYFLWKLSLQLTK